MAKLNGVRWSAISGVLLVASSLLLGGCKSTDHSANSVKPAIVTTKKQPSTFAKNYAAAKRTATENRSAFSSELADLKRFDRGYDATYLNALPTKLSEEAENVDVVLRGTITKTSFSSYENTPHTLYTLFVSDVYSGDTSLKGKEVTLLTLGGKIKNADLYASYQQKSFIPADKKLTPEELQQYTVVRADGFDPAAPGDELVATLKKVYNNALQQDVYLTISPEWIFYRTKGSQDFVMHEQTKGVGGGDSTSNALPPSNDNPSTKGQIVNDVNQMVDTGKLP